MTKNRGQGGLVRVGDIPQLKQLQKRLEKELKPPSRAQLDLIDAALAIQSEPDAAERAFLARQLILCTLPHSDPGSVEGWTRRTGSLALGIQPGFEYDTGKSIGYPFGTIPRLLLYWIGAEIQKDKNRDDLTLIEKRTLHLGRNLAAFMRAVGLNPRGGGKRGDAKRLHNQADRLFSSRIGWVEKPQQGSAHGVFRTSVEFSPHYELWWNVRSPEQGVFWESKVLLGEILYSAFASSSVPLDMRALRALKRSPLALDLYAMLAYRAFVILQKNLPPQFIAWEQLRCQFGTDYSDPKNFKKKAAAALRKIATVYPGLTITKAKGGFAIHATRLAVPQKASA